MALAFVVPCQAGGSVLLQPHGHGVADVLPAVQKVAERDSGAEREDVRQEENKINTRSSSQSLSTVIIQDSVQGCKTSVSSLALSDRSDSRKRTRTSLPANGVGGSSLSQTRLVRSLGNLHVVAGNSDPMCCEPRGSHRDTASVRANTGTLINLNAAQGHLQASSLRHSLSPAETWGYNYMQIKTLLVFYLKDR
ncbi:hypothetical protein XENORESO_008435 [Xenotaenia resolanae]|uniref:Uncharacterized protein n=1 Tax=Xenotaenia resolanae TaxID=208358 RepID=A0ABV0WFR9_9TELE